MCTNRGQQSKTIVTTFGGVDINREPFPPEKEGNASKCDQEIIRYT